MVSLAVSTGLRCCDIVALRLEESTGAATRSGWSRPRHPSRWCCRCQLLGDPGVLILDEPTNGLDPAGIHWLRLLLRCLADEGRTVVMSSHLLAEVAHAVDDVVILTRGRLRAHRAMSTIDSLEDFFLNVTGDVTKMNEENTRCAP